MRKRIKNKNKNTIIFAITMLFLLVLAALLIVSILQPANPGGESSSPASQAESSENASSVAESSSQAEQSQPQPSQAESSEPVVPADSIVHFLACPDNIIHASVYYDAINVAARKAGVDPVYSPLATATYDFADMYADVAEQIRSADIAYVNVETLIGGNENGIRAYPTFNTPSVNGELLCELGFDVFNVAHNHMLDSYDDEFLINCNKFFTDRNKTVIGYYEDEAATDDIVVYECKGIKIALLAYTYSTNGIALPSGSKTYIPYFEEELIRKQVAKAKSVADVVLVSAHWGNEDSYEINSYQRSYAQLLIDLEVDAIIGMHPHCIQPMSFKTSESGHKTLLVYSLGNFISGMNTGGHNMLGGMLGFDIVKDGETGEISIEQVLFTPIVTHYTEGVGLNDTDSGQRNYHLYYLSDYTEELAAQHRIPKLEVEKKRNRTLVGGGFTRANLVLTVQKYIPAEFLPEEFKY